MGQLLRATVAFVHGRLLPALLTSIGVALVAGGLLSYTGPVAAVPPEPTSSAVTPVAGQTTSPAESATPARGSPTPAGPSASPGPSASTGPSASPSPSASGRVATRVVIPALGIDLPIVRQADGPDSYPYCNVAMYITELHQPGEAGATYIYAHARVGMFLPILEASRIDDGARMLHMLVQVFTSDDQLFLYDIVEVRRHQISLAAALAAKEPQLWLQTSEGPKGTPGKTQLVAELLSTSPADHAQANPIPHPVVCG